MKRKKSTNNTKRGAIHHNVGESRNVTPDDVLAALLELFSKLKTKPPELASRVKMLGPERPSEHSLFSHTAAVGELLV